MTGPPSEVAGRAPCSQSMALNFQDSLRDRSHRVGRHRSVHDLRHVITQWSRVALPQWRFRGPGCGQSLLVLWAAAAGPLRPSRQPSVWPPIPGASTIRARRGRSTPSLVAPMLAFVTTCLEVGKRQRAASDVGRGGGLSPSLVCGNISGTLGVGGPGEAASHGKVPQSLAAQDPPAIWSKLVS